MHNLRPWLHLFQKFMGLRELLTYYQEVVLTHAIRGILQLVIRGEDYHCIARVFIDRLNEVHS